jgi:hypothetical protein
LLLFWPPPHEPRPAIAVGVGHVLLKASAQCSRLQSDLRGFVSVRGAPDEGLNPLRRALARDQFTPIQFVLVHIGERRRIALLCGAVPAKASRATTP